MPSISSPPGASTAWSPGRIARSSTCRSAQRSPRRISSTPTAPWSAPRAARRALKAMAGNAAAELYRRAKQLELDAEREAQRNLVASLPRGLESPADPVADAGANFARYATAHGVDAAAGRALLLALR